jgi:hypothetical protein
MQIPPFPKLLVTLQHLIEGLLPSTPAPRRFNDLRAALRERDLPDPFVDQREKAFWKAFPARNGARDRDFARLCCGGLDVSAR